MATVTTTHTIDAILAPIVPTYRYRIPVTFDSVTSGDYLQATIADWTDIVSNKRALTSGNDVRVFKTDGTELARNFSSGTLTWQADNTDTTYYIYFGKSDAGSPTTLSVDNALHLETRPAENCYYTRTESTGFNGEFTCEMSAYVSTYESSHSGLGVTPYLQVLEKSKCAARIGPLDATTVKCGWHNGTIWTYSDVTVSDLGSSDHKYRIWYDNTAGAIKFYLDGTLIYTHSGPHYTAAANTVVYFADGDTDAHGTAEFYISYVYYDDSAGSGLAHDGDPTDWAVAYTADALPQSSTPVWTRTANATPLTEEITTRITATGTCGTRIVASSELVTWEPVSCTTGGDTDVACYGAESYPGREYSQAFSVGATTNLAKVGLWLKCETDSKPADSAYSEWITARIETDSGGSPSGTIIGQMRIPYCIIKKNSAGYGEVIFHNLSNTTITAGTDYHLILSVPKNTSTNSVLWSQDASSPSYTEGVCTRTRSATSWNAWGSRDTSKSFLFSVYAGFQGAPSLPDVSVTASQAPYILPSALPAWVEDAPPGYGLNGLLDTGTEKYFAMWSIDASCYEDQGISSFVVKDSDKSVSTTTKMLDGYVDGTVADTQKRVTAYWLDGATYKGIATNKTIPGYRRLHYINSAGIMDTAYTDAGELTIDTTDPAEHKFATLVEEGEQSYLYFDISPNETLYAEDVVGNAKAVRAKYNGTTALTDFEFVEWDMDGLSGDVAQAWAYRTTREGETYYVGFIFAQWVSGSYYTGTIYYAKSLDGIIWSPAKALRSFGPSATLTGAATAGTNTFTISTTDAALFAIDDYIAIQGANPNEFVQEELRKITNINTGTGVITVDTNFTYTHAIGRKTGRLDCNQAIAYSADFSTPSSAKLWGYVMPGSSWSNAAGGLNGWIYGHYPMEFTGDLQLLIGASTLYATHTIDGIVVGSEVTHTIDAIISNQTTATHTVDAIVMVQSTATHTIDGVISTSSVATHTIDGIVVEIPYAPFASPPTMANDESGVTKGVNKGAVSPRTTTGIIKGIDDWRP